MADEKECSRCGTWLGSDEGICPTCGEVYGNQTIFQMPQISKEMIEEDRRRYERETLAARPASTARSAAGVVPSPAPPAPSAPAAAFDDDVDPTGDTLRARPPQAGSSSTATPQLAPGAAPTRGGGPSFTVVLVGVLLGALVLGVVIGLLIL